MQTVRTLEAGWRQVLLGSVSTEAKEAESSTGHIWAAGFHHVMARSRLSRVLKLYEPFISFIFTFFSGCSKPRITEIADTESADPGAHLYLKKKILVMFCHKFCKNYFVTQLCTYNTLRYNCITLQSCSCSECGHSLLK
jgi:hypothetical protein